MSLTSLKFLAFAIAVLALFRRTSAAKRWVVLLAASYLFCVAASPTAALLLAAVSLVNYFFGILIENTEPAHRTPSLGVAIALNVTMLFIFKYLFVGSIAIPIGLSIYVFQAISYLVDVSLETIPAERHLGHFFLYLSYFPKLLQGPLERAREFLPQLKSGLRYDEGQFCSGLPLIVLGAFKKIIIADALGDVANAVFNDIPSHRGLGVLVAMYAFTLQIYFDFAGYTDIARGLSRAFGLELSSNFDAPYLAANIQEFWRRWHVTLSSWLRDYLFIPLAASLRDFGKSGVVLAALLTFLICGVWHGAGWGYFVFGLLHGIFIAVSLLTLKKRDQWITSNGLNADVVLWWHRAVTFHLVAFAFIFFRCPTLGDSFQFISRIPGPLDLASIAHVLPPLRAASLGLGLCLFAVPNLIESWSQRTPALFYAMLTNMLIVFGAKSNVPFIYNKF